MFLRRKNRKEDHAVATKKLEVQESETREMIKRVRILEAEVGILKPTRPKGA